jgi:hypothetical protein
LNSGFAFFEMRKTIISLGMRVSRSGEEFHTTVTHWVENGRDPELRESCKSLAELYEKELDQLIARLRSLKPSLETDRRLQQALEHKSTLTHHAGYLAKPDGW